VHGGIGAFDAHVALEVTDRNVDPEVIVLAAGLEQQNRGVRVRRQAVGEHATRGPGAYDDVVELLHCGRILTAIAVEAAS
jgi:hypothetical protein